MLLLYVQWIVEAEDHLVAVAWSALLDYSDLSCLDAAVQHLKLLDCVYRCALCCVSGYDAVVHLCGHANSGRLFLIRQASDLRYGGPEIQNMAI